MSRVHRVKAVKVTLADGQTGQSFFNLQRDVEKLEELSERILEVDNWRELLTATKRRRNGRRRPDA